MEHNPFDIIKVLANDTLAWVESAKELTAARIRVWELLACSPGEYIVFNQQTGRASGLQVNVQLQVSLVERASGKVIFSRPNFDFHDRYETAVTNTNQYFEESGPALERLSRSVARDVVTSILDNF